MVTKDKITGKLDIKHSFPYKLIWRVFCATFIQNGIV